MSHAGVCEGWGVEVCVKGGGWWGCGGMCDGWGGVGEVCNTCDSLSLRSNKTQLGRPDTLVPLIVQSSCFEREASGVCIGEPR